MNTRTPTKPQFLFLKIVAARGTEKTNGEVDGVSVSTQRAAELAGWVTTRPGIVNTWERWYVLTPAGEEAIAAYRQLKAQAQP